MLCGSLPDAKERYVQAVEILKKEQDALWLSATQESLACVDVVTLDRDHNCLLIDVRCLSLASINLFSRCREQMN